jgi:hypothetical protein
MILKMSERKTHMTTKTKVAQTWMKTRTTLHRHWLVILILFLLCSPILFFLLSHLRR